MLITNKILIYILRIVLILGIVLTLLKLNKNVFLQKRYKEYTLEKLNNNEISIIDKIIKIYYYIKKEISKRIKKSVALTDYSKKYKKYINGPKKAKQKPIDFISTKFIWGFLFVIFIITTSLLGFQKWNLTLILFFFLLGFFVPDIYWIIGSKIRRKQVDTDMLKAIIIMNNSFKSGLSIMQAIKMVSNELEGPIAEEFKKMYMDITFGLDMDLVFQRFSKRVNTEEAHYITTSLSVLNKTGGNIVHVFASVEKNAFTRKKLKEELAASAASAKAIYKLLLFIPPAISLIIYLLNPVYFKPLFNTSIGRIILVLLITIYTVYVVIIRKIINIGD